MVRTDLTEYETSSEQNAVCVDVPTDVTTKSLPATPTTLEKENEKRVKKKGCRKCKILCKNDCVLILIKMQLLEALMTAGYI